MPRACAWVKSAVVAENLDRLNAPSVSTLAHGLFSGPFPGHKFLRLMVLWLWWVGLPWVFPQGCSWQSALSPVRSRLRPA